MGTNVRALRLMFVVALGASVAGLGCKSGSGNSGAKTAADLQKKITNAINTANNIADKANTAVNTADQAATMLQGGAASAPAPGTDTGQTTAPTVSVTASGGSDPAPSTAGASPDQAVTPGGNAMSAAAPFVGGWTCLASVDIAPPVGQPVHIQGTGPWIVVSNSDGTISMIDPKNHDQCPPGKWSVSGSTAKAITDSCSKPDGTVVRTVRGDATVSAKSLTANGVAAVSGSNTFQVNYSLQCAR